MGKARVFRKLMKKLGKVDEILPKDLPKDIPVLPEKLADRIKSLKGENMKMRADEMSDHFPPYGSEKWDTESFDQYLDMLQRKDPDQFRYRDPDGDYYTDLNEVADDLRGEIHSTDPGARYSGEQLRAAKKLRESNKKVRRAEKKLERRDLLDEADAMEGKSSAIPMGRSEKEALRDEVAKFMRKRDYKPGEGWEDNIDQDMVEELVEMLEKQHGKKPLSKSVDWDKKSPFKSIKKK